MPIVTRREKSTPAMRSRKPCTKCWRDCSPSVTMSMPASSCSRRARRTASRLASSSAAPARLHGAHSVSGFASQDGFGKLPAIVVRSIDAVNSTLAPCRDRKTSTPLGPPRYNSTDRRVRRPLTLVLGGVDLHFADSRLAPVWDKVQGGRRLTRDDGLRLFATDDLLGVGRMADHAKSRREGDRVYFVINRYISPTNVCVLSCAFCGFARKPGEAGAFEYTIEDIVGMVKDEVREVHIVGGHHPDWPFEYYERIIAALHAARPDVQIKAFTAAEIDYFCRRWKLEPREVLTRLKAAGLQTMPGGGAEIFSARVAKLLKYTGKADA